MGAIVTAAEPAVYLHKEGRIDLHLSIFEVPTCRFSQFYRSLLHPRQYAPPTATVTAADATRACICCVSQQLEPATESWSEHLSHSAKECLDSRHVLFRGIGLANDTKLSPCAPRLVLTIATLPRGQPLQFSEPVSWRAMMHLM